MNYWKIYTPTALYFFFNKWGRPITFFCIITDTQIIFLDQPRIVNSFTTISLQLKSPTFQITIAENHCWLIPDVFLL